jgi:hypothetical protein
VSTAATHSHVAVPVIDPRMSPCRLTEPPSRMCERMNEGIIEACRPVHMTRVLSAERPVLIWGIRSVVPAPGSLTQVALYHDIAQTDQRRRNYRLITSLRGLLISRGKQNMTSIELALRTLAERIGRLLTKELFPTDTAPVLPVTPVPPSVRIHRATDEDRSS